MLYSSRMTKTAGFKLEQRVLSPAISLNAQESMPLCLARMSENAVLRCGCPRQRVTTRPKTLHTACLGFLMLTCHYSMGKVVSQLLDFRNSASIFPLPDLDSNTPYAMINHGIQVEFPIVDGARNDTHDRLAVLQCTCQGTLRLKVAIRLFRLTEQSSVHYARREEMTSNYSLGA